MTKFGQSRHYIASTGFVFALVGCATPPAEPLGAATTEAPNPIQVTLVREGHALHFAPAAAIPDRLETASLNQFLAASGAAPGDTILIERTPPSTLKGNTLEVRREATLVAALTRQGLRPSVSYTPTLLPGDMSLTLERYVASAPNCPNWSKTPGNDFGNTLHSDFGCSTATNLAAMIADPHDLVVGRTMGPLVGDPGSSPVHAYRAGKVAPLSDGTPGATTASTPGATQQ
jgi:pilus assembly protein CpaD